MAVFNWQLEQERMTAHRREIQEFREAFETTEVAARHGELRGFRDAAFEERLENGSTQTQLAARIQAGAPGLSLEAAHFHAAQRMGIL